MRCVLIIHKNQCATFRNVLHSFVSYLPLQITLDPQRLCNVHLNYLNVMERAATTKMVTRLGHFSSLDPLKRQMFEPRAFVVRESYPISVPPTYTKHISHKELRHTRFLPLGWPDHQRNKWCYEMWHKNVANFVCIWFFVASRTTSLSIASVIWRHFTHLNDSARKISAAPPMPSLGDATREISRRRASQPRSSSFAIVWLVLCGSGDGNLLFLYDAPHGRRRRLRARLSTLDYVAECIGCELCLYDWALLDGTEY